MEMLLTPDSSDQKVYKLQFWHDRQLIGERVLSDFAKYLEPGKELKVGLNFFAGEDMAESIKVEVDDLTISSIAVHEVMH